MLNSPVRWPTIDPAPISEFKSSGMALLAFIKLFPLGMLFDAWYCIYNWSIVITTIFFILVQADPTRKGRIEKLAASSHLLKYAEVDPLNPSALYYPFAEHERFLFG